MMKNWDPPEFGFIALAILVVLAFLDRDDRGIKTGVMRVSTILGSFAGIVLFTTAMYVAFTPVGSQEINGCQPRYLIPLLFPAWYINSFDRVNLKWNRNLLPLMMIAVMGLINIVSLGSILASIY